MIWVLLALAAQAESTIAPCYRYSYENSFSLEKGAPEGVRIGKDGRLENSSNQPLLVELHRGRCLKLMSSAVYEAANCARALKSEKKEAEFTALTYTRINNFARHRTVEDPTLLGSNEKAPAKPAAYTFEIPAKLNGQAIRIRVVGDYRLVEKNCQQGN